MRTQKVAEGIATIDVSLIVIKTGTEEDGLEIALDTANNIQVATQTETTDAIRLMKLGRLLAQKQGSSTITGHQITITDNLFYPELMKVFQGGTLIENSDSTGYPHYEPPVAGSTDKGEIFEMECYSAQYDASGQIEKYEKITYPNCQGTPIAINTQDDVFRLPEYVINSAPKTGEPPYKIDYVDKLPIFASRYSADISGTESTRNISVPSIEESNMTMPSVRKK